MYSKQAQSHTKEISYSNPTIFHSSTSKRGNLSHFSKHIKPGYKNETNKTSSYKYYVPASSKGVTTTSNFISPSNAKITNVSSSNSSAKNVPIHYSNGTYINKNKIANRSQGQQLSSHIITSSRNNQNGRKYSFKQSNGNTALHSNTKPFNKHVSSLKSQKLVDSGFKSKKNFASNDYHHRNVYHRTDNSIPKPKIRNNQFKTSGQLRDIYNPKINTETKTNPNSQYNSNANIYNNLASNSFPNNLNTQKDNHSNKYKIKEIDPFSKNNIHKRNRINSVTSPKFRTPQLTSKQNISTRNNHLTNDSHQFQLTQNSYKNVYEKK